MDAVRRHGLPRVSLRRGLPWARPGIRCPSGAHISPQRTRPPSPFEVDPLGRNTRVVRRHHLAPARAAALPPAARTGAVPAAVVAARLVRTEEAKHHTRPLPREQPGHHHYYHSRRHHAQHATMTMANYQDDKKQTVLHINASITHDSVTARVATAVLDHLTHHYHRHVQNGTSKPQNPEDVLNIEELDVWGDKLPKFDREIMQKVWRARNNSQDEADIEAFRPIQMLAEQMLRADFLMITVPVWNFSVPYVVKQYIDCIVQPGLTFKNADASGPSRPYFTGRPVIIISSSGGKAPPVNEDFVVPFLTKIFAMCGFDEAHHVAIEGLATHDKQVCYENAVKEANAIADQVVQNHKLRLEANEDGTLA